MKCQSLFSVKKLKEIPAVCCSVDSAQRVVLVKVLIVIN